MLFEARVGHPGIGYRLIAQVLNLVQQTQGLKSEELTSEEVPKQSG